jgi:iron complex outermembrane receptor protein
VLAGAFAPFVHADEGLDEVVVSARKRTEKAHDVPISLSEISGDELQARGLVRVQDILRQMPNVSTDILSARQASLAIRGLGRNPANDALESSVGVFLDGVYLGRPGMMISDLVDLERFEVLRGPQGALFGKNATAGVVNILSARPTSERSGWFELSAGDHDLRELRGAVSGPIGRAIPCAANGSAKCIGLALAPSSSGGPVPRRRCD